MSRRLGKRSHFPVNVLAALVVILSVGVINARTTSSGALAAVTQPFCSAHAQICTETHRPWNYKGQYTGHDEPSVLFYSKTAGSGNSNLPSHVRHVPAEHPRALGGSFLQRGVLGRDRAL